MEHQALLQGVLEVCMKDRYPDDYKRITELSSDFSSGWRKLHNAYTDEKITDVLTATEFAIAMLASRGWSNKDIAKHLSLSIYTVKHHVSDALQKLGIEKRSQLRKYVHP